MENYIVINGNKAELTKEQLEKLGIEISKKRNNPFDRVRYHKNYFTIQDNGSVVKLTEYDNIFDTERYKYANYFNSEEFGEQMSLKSLLNRKLEKYAWDNGAEDVEWDGKKKHYFIYYNRLNKNFAIITNSNWKGCNVVYFSIRKAAQGAIEDVIKPFMSEHPNFKW